MVYTWSYDVRHPYSYIIHTYIYRYISIWVTEILAYKRYLLLNVKTEIYIIYLIWQLANQQNYLCYIDYKLRIDNAGHIQCIGFQSELMYAKQVYAIRKPAFKPREVLCVEISGWFAFGSIPINLNGYIIANNIFLALYYLDGYIYKHI